MQQNPVLHRYQKTNDGGHYCLAGPAYDLIAKNKISRAGVRVLGPGIVAFY
jgi:hypothetical protein